MVASVPIILIEPSLTNKSVQGDVSDPKFIAGVAPATVTPVGKIDPLT